jgi:hypothetical protein
MFPRDTRWHAACLHVDRIRPIARVGRITP